MGATTTPALVGTPADIDAAYLTTVLRHAGFSDATVGTFSASNIGTGQVGQNIRFALDYEAGKGPATVVGKFASDDPASRQTGIALQNYLKEVRFYRELAPSLAVRIPALYFGAIDEETHEFLLMMEDMAPAEQGDQLGGCSADDAALAMEQAAHLHGPRWDDPTLRNFDFLGGLDEDAGAAGTLALWDAAMEAYLARYVERLSTEDVALTRALGGRFAAYLSPEPGPRTVTHGDFRLDNMLFGRTPGATPLAIVDWQSPALGQGPADVAYFLGTSLDPALRGKEERALLRVYRDVLKSYGVSLSEDALWRAYRRASFAGLVMAVVASMIVGQTDRGDHMFMAMAQRSAVMARELEGLALLS